MLHLCMYGIAGVIMALLGLFIYYTLGDIYPYDLIAFSCLTESAIYMRIMRITICPA